MLPNPKLGVLLAPASQTNSATRTANLDLLGADYAIIQIPLASAINTNAVGPTIVLKESDDTQATNFSTWLTACTVTAKSIVNANEQVFKFDTRARKRYVQISLTTNNTTNDNVTASATYALFRMGTGQPAASNMLASTNDAVTIL